MNTLSALVIAMNYFMTQPSIPTSYIATEVSCISEIIHFDSKTHAWVDKVNSANKATALVQSHQHPNSYCDLIKDDTYFNYVSQSYTLDKLYFVNYREEYDFGETLNIALSAWHGDLYKLLDQKE
ncbi:MAG: hypothetical protein IBX57_00710 [Gammaproteobacteria bacterium]|nr:hypothetical protein [Gammaproteobacteria bacterium]